MDEYHNCPRCAGIMVKTEEYFDKNTNALVQTDYDCTECNLTLEFWNNGLIIELNRS